MEDRDFAHIKLARDRLTWEHIAFAFALSGPYGGVPESETSKLSAKSTLSILRSLLTIGVQLTDPASLKILAQTNKNCVDELLQTLGDDPAVKGAWRALPSTETSIEGLNIKTSGRIANKIFFGVDESLSHLLTSRTPLHINQGTSELYASSAHKASRSMLAGHSKQPDFEFWIEQSTDTARSVSNFSGRIDFGILDFLQKDSEWSFWFDWYSHILKGDPLQLELQLRIAQISETDWQLGTHHIAKRIQEIRTRFDLEQRIDKLKEDNARLAERSRFEIGANGGPELEETKRVVHEIIWAPIEALEAETQKEEPDTGVIRKALDKLKHGASWLLTKSAENSLTFGMGWYLSDPTKAKAALQSIITASERWLQALINLVG